VGIADSPPDLYEPLASPLVHADEVDVPSHLADRDLAARLRHVDEQ
jgi:hypothetical protein